MIRNVPMCVLAVVVGLLTASTARVQGVEPAAQPFALTVSVRHASKQGQFDWTVVAVEAASGKTVFAPKITSQAGQSASASATDAEGVFFGITVTVDKGGKVGAYTFVATKDGAQVQKAAGIVTVT